VTRRRPYTVGPTAGRLPAVEVRSLRGPGTLLLLAALALALPACGHTYEVESRETRVNVWLTAPSIAAEGGSIDALIYVGPYKVVEGPVQFPKGVSTVILPPLFIRSGQRKVSVVLGGGRYTATSNVKIEREGWIDITLRSRALSIAFTEVEPSRIGR